MSDTNIANASVLEKTGKKWDAWFKLLDRWGAANKTHKETAKHLAAEHGLSAWWSQMVTVEYERARGLRKVNERAGGYAFSVSRTIAAPRRRIYDAFTDAKELSRWFTHDAKVEARVGGRYTNGDGDSGTFLTLKPPSVVRFTWENAKHAPGSVVEVRIDAKDRGRAVATLTHSKLRTAREVKDLRDGWSWAMDSLRSYLEPGEPIQHEDWVRAKRGR